MTTVQAKIETASASLVAGVKFKGTPAQIVFATRLLQYELTKSGFATASKDGDALANIKEYAGRILLAGKVRGGTDAGAIIKKLEGNTSVFHKDDEIVAAIIRQYGHRLNMEKLQAAA